MSRGCFWRGLTHPLHLQCRWAQANKRRNRRLLGPCRERGINFCLHIKVSARLHLDPRFTPAISGVLKLSASVTPLAFLPPRTWDGLIHATCIPASGLQAAHCGTSQLSQSCKPAPSTNPLLHIYTILLILSSLRLTHTPASEKT